MKVLANVNSLGGAGRGVKGLCNVEEMFWTEEVACNRIIGNR